jgi:hypothetical protein
VLHIPTPLARGKAKRNLITLVKAYHHPIQRPYYIITSLAFAFDLNEGNKVDRFCFVVTNVIRLVHSEIRSVP